MSSDSDEDNKKLRQLEAELCRIQEEIKTIREKKEKRKLIKQDTNITTGYKENKLSSEKANRFRTYEKGQGTSDYGREYERIKCAFYALKLIACDAVENFEITTDNQKYKPFDDLEIKVTFKNKETRTYLFQFKYKESAKSITKRDLVTEKSAFNVEKYLSFKSSNPDINEDFVCILYTNAPLHIKGEREIGEKIFVKKSDNVEDDNFLLNLTQERQENIFTIKQDLNNKNHLFYFFTEQDDVKQTGLRVEKLLENLLQCNIYDSFMYFMYKWQSKKFVLTKHDVITKLTELVLSPYIETLSETKKNEKTENLKQAVMGFAVGIAEKNAIDLIKDIWSHEESLPEDFNEIKEKFAVKKSEQVKILWYLNRVPLVVSVNEVNTRAINCAVKLFGTIVDKKTIILVGNVNVTRSEFNTMEVFQNLSDFMKKSTNRDLVCDILKNFTISLQGREEITLQQLLDIDINIARHIGLGELLKMSQTTLIIGSDKVEELKFHIIRNISTTCVKTKKILTLSQKNNTVVIINCNPTFESHLSTDIDFHGVKVSDYLNEQYDFKKPIILLFTKNKCTPDEFRQICEMSSKANVYLFHQVDDESCVLLLQKGNELSAEHMDEPKTITETDIFRYFDNPINVISAPSGMGKSTLMKVFYNNCPPNYWGIYVDLINCNSFLREKSEVETLWNHIYDNKNTNGDLEKQVKDSLRNKKMLYLFLDGLDEVNSGHLHLILKFIKDTSSTGIKLWISSRENLRGKITQTLNVVPTGIQALNKDQKKEYIYQKLKEKYSEEDIENILRIIFESADLNNLQDLLGVPLQLHIITEMFLNNDETVENIKEEKMFILSKMYRLFLDGKMKAAINKVTNEKQIHLLGNLNVLLKQYEPIALKTCLNHDDLEILNVDSEAESYIKEIKTNGDRYGIIKEINESEQAIFHHQTFAEYFACVWLKNNIKMYPSLKNSIFSEKYANLRLMFDIMLAEECPLHLSVLYKNFEEFEKHRETAHNKDAGGRTALHLLCTRGMIYPTIFTDDVRREHDWYVKMIRILMTKNTNVHDKDSLFDFDYVHFSLEAKCLYPIELILKNELAKFDDLKDVIFEYYDCETLACYAARMGYFNLFDALIKLLSSEQLQTGMEKFLLLAVRGTQNDTVTLLREGNIAVVKCILESDSPFNKNRALGIDISKILDIAWKEGKRDMPGVLIKYSVED